MATGQVCVGRFTKTGKGCNENDKAANTKTGWPQVRGVWGVISKLFKVRGLLQEKLVKVNELRMAQY